MKMVFVKEIIVWVGIWIIGCVVFDMWLELKGAWLMLCGVITYFVCDSVQNWMRSNAGVQAAAQPVACNEMLGAERPGKD